MRIIFKNCAKYDIIQKKLHVNHAFCTWTGCARKRLVKTYETNFYGADHEVTGSCHLLQACGKNILVDCGMEQGPNLYENQEIPVPPPEIDYVLLTHAHIDHSGLLPLLVKNGFKGGIVTTFATSDLCNVMLRDSAHIQEFEAEWRNRKGKRAGQPEIEPLYTVQEPLMLSHCLSPVIIIRKLNSVKESGSDLPMWGICLVLPVSKCGSRKERFRRRSYFPEISETWISPSSKIRSQPKKQIMW